MAKKHFSLQHSESVIIQAAANIYAAYISSGRVAEGEQSQWMERSIREAMTIARATDDAIVSDDELDSSDRLNLGEIAVGRRDAGRGKHQA